MVPLDFDAGRFRQKGGTPARWSVLKIFVKLLGPVMAGDRQRLASAGVHNTSVERQRAISLACRSFSRSATGARPASWQRWIGEGRCRFDECQKIAADHIRDPPVLADEMPVNLIEVAAFEAIHLEFGNSVAALRDYAERKSGLDLLGQLCDRFVVVAAQAGGELATDPANDIDEVVGHHCLSSDLHLRHVRLYSVESAAQRRMGVYRSLWLTDRLNRSSFENENSTHAAS